MRMSAFGCGFQLVTATLLVVYRQGFRSPRSPRALIEPQRDPVQVRLREAREICSPREILSQQAVGVLVAAALPRTAWIAEIYRGREGRDRAQALDSARDRQTRPRVQGMGDRRRGVAAGDPPLHAR